MVAANGIPSWLMLEHPVSIQKARKRWGICSRTLKRYFAEGLEGYRIGGKRFTTAEALGRFGVCLSSVVADEPPTTPRTSRRAKKDQQEAAALLGG
jgi:hypothetical protein